MEFGLYSVKELGSRDLLWSKYKFYVFWLKHSLILFYIAACVVHESQKVPELLIKKGINIDIQDEYGRTPLLRGIFF
jgi:hypothetical protein